ncbi:acyl carrier protein [Ramlibacter sp.]|uniref:acyl carrier protein n=1 Tax=Ramlibacter sp. TaxID=1917967 RepID=UPI00183DBA02|nr:acyl carrier protein [Ramlibacter sp.]MBA2674455.1 acyl carrier protein [Ramlibacter sp.]
MSEQTKLELLAVEVARILNVETVDVDTPMGELGVDSLNVVELVLVCEQLYTGSVDPERLSIDQYTSLRELDAQLTEAAVTAG